MIDWPLCVTSILSIGVVGSDTMRQAGDLVFFGTSPTNVTHVGIALGGSLMVNAPTFNEKVRVDHFRNAGNLIGASRPTANLAT
jgi:cell wall-associated NlpC family hydrolase